MQKFEITNPEALKWIEDYKSGKLFEPIKQKLIKYKVYLLIGTVLLVLLIFYVIGRGLANRVTDPVYKLPPASSLKPTQSTEEKSVYESLKQDILDFTSDLPDPALPDFDNNINLEPNELIN